MENYVVHPMIALASYKEGAQCRRQPYPTFRAAELAAILHALSEPWRTSAQLSWHDEAGWHRNWYEHDMSQPTYPLMLKQD